MDKLMLLSQINLLDELPEEELKKLDEVTVTVPIKKGTIILSPTQQMRSLFFLKKDRFVYIRYPQQERNSQLIF